MPQLQNNSMLLKTEKQSINSSHQRIMNISADLTNIKSITKTAPKH
jgi:hypothetical protein